MEDENCTCEMQKKKARKDVKKETLGLKIFFDGAKEQRSWK